MSKYKSLQQALDQLEKHCSAPENVVELFEESQTYFEQVGDVRRKQRQLETTMDPILEHIKKDISADEFQDLLQGGQQLDLETIVKEELAYRIH